MQKVDIDRSVSSQTQRYCIVMPMAKREKIRLIGFFARLRLVAAGKELTSKRLLYPACKIAHQAC